MKEITPKNNQVEETDYKNLLHELKDILNKGLYTVYKAVDNIKVQTYWQIGERIVREELKNKNRAGYGKYLIEKLIVDLNFSRPELYRIIKFYRCYEIVSTVSRQLSWSHYLELCSISDEKIRNFYQNKIIKHSWSVRELHKQIKSQLYEKTNSEEIEKILQTTLPTIETTEIFKETYNFNFLDFKKGDKEKMLENLIVSNIEAFLKEIGEDFTFVGRQVPIKIDDQTHFIDLVLYHKAIPCNILVDLKTEKISSKDIGQMNKYIGYYQKYRQYKHDKDTIGLIIGGEAGKEEIEFALNKLEKQIFIAVYKTKLPSDEKIKEAVKKLEDKS
jgi:predicted nuclease of restriction endonuclease-like (RecB) superfamily